jgi:hypothetical protein
VAWGVLGITAAMLVGAGVIYAVDRWRRRAASGPTDADTAAELTGFREMYDNGEITEVEYAELRRRVADRMKKPAASPTPATLTAPSDDRGRRGDSAFATQQEPPGVAPPPPPPPPPAGPTESPPPPAPA